MWRGSLLSCWRRRRWHSTAGACSFWSQHASSCLIRWGSWDVCYDVSAHHSLPHHKADYITGTNYFMQKQFPSLKYITLFWIFYFMSFSTTIWQPPEMISRPTWGLGPPGCECSFLSSVYATDAAAKQGVSNTLLLSLSLSLSLFYLYFGYLVLQMTLVFIFGNILNSSYSG